jgi:hypothetical protein
VQVPPEPAEGAAGALVLAFRLPDGARLSRRFLQSDSVAAAVSYVAQQMRASGALSEQQSVALATQFPSRVLQDADATLLDVGVQDRDILVVQRC